MTTERAVPGIADYTAAYRAARTSPVDVARRLIEAIQATDRGSPPLRAFIAQDADDLLQQARASAARYEAGAPLGPLDGVPIAVKDEMDQAGYPTMVGTTFLGTQRAERDATVVARLRAAGALLPGKTNMHEIGIGVTGINPHHGSARNPHDPARITGGSSSGSAAAVASALCPVAIGADGGGSIRIPAALCGVTGIKPTFGRVSEAGAAPLCWTLAHIGPIAGTLEDGALVLQTIAGPDPADPQTLGQPALDLDTNDALDLTGLRVGWDEQWASLARADVREACRRSLDHLVAAGAELREVHIEEVEQIRLVGYVTIGCEMAASQHEHRRTTADKRRYGADVRLLLEMASQLPAVDYVRAQRVRTMIQRRFDTALEHVDLIATPMTGTTAPVLDPRAERSGQQDDEVLASLLAFSFAANLTGLPALSVPAGHDHEGLPIGLQLIGRHWDEASCIRAGRVVERWNAWRKPRVFAPPLQG